MNVDELRQLYATNVAAKALCELMASRQNNQNETKLERILGILQNNGREVKRSELIAAFRRLEQIGCGEYVEGRRGWPSRFVWAVGSISACRAAIGETSVVESIEQSAIQTDSKNSWLSHTFNLRVDMQIELALPVDLTQSEAERLATFVRTLPFEEYE